MTSLLAKLADPDRWRRAALSYIELWRRDRGDDALDRQLAEIGQVDVRPGEAMVIAEGMWPNPNHFHRLRLFIEALARRDRFRLLGVLRRRKDWRERRALERIGFSEFICIEDDAEFRTENFLAEADRLLAGTHSHADLLALNLPEGLPAYTWYDTALKLARHPQPALNDPIWRTTLAETLRDVAIYARLLATGPIKHVVTSHPWKSEWASLTWLALQRGAPVSHLTGFCESMRIRRMRRPEDYAILVEHLPFAVFDRLDPSTQAQLAAFGQADMARRVSGQSSDINTRSAFDPARRITDRNKARLALSGQTERPVAVVFSHAWYDFPHQFAMAHFTDFRDWLQVTLQAIRALPDVIWLLKPHPTEAWYGGCGLADLIGDLPSHIRLLPLKTDAKTALTAADAVVTVHGTCAMEAAAQGVPVILADRSYFSDWGFAHAARDRDDYSRFLGEVGRLAKPDETARQRAAACFALAVAEPPAELGAMRISCDSSGSALYGEISRRYRAAPQVIAREIERIGAFLDQEEIDSFATFHLVKLARAAGLQCVT
jgi:hypothetical protein